MFDRKIVGLMGALAIFLVAADKRTEAQAPTGTASASHSGSAAPVIVLQKGQPLDISQRAPYLIDPFDRFDIDDVKEQSFRQPPADPMQFSGVRWFRFALRAPPDTQWVIAIASVGPCSEADLYVPKPVGGSSLLRFGSTSSFEERGIGTFQFGTVLNPSNLHGEALYLRTRCLSYASKIKVEPLANFQKWNDGWYWPENTPIIALQLGLLILQVSFAVILRSRLYALSALPGAVYLASLTYPALYQLFPAAAFVDANVIQASITSLLFLTQWYFVTRLLALGNRAPMFERAFAAALIIGILCNFNLAFPIPVESVRAYLTISTLAPYLIFYGTAFLYGLAGIRLGIPAAWYVVAGYAVIGFGQALSNFGGNITPGDNTAGRFAYFAINYASGYAFPIDGLLFFMAIADQMRRAARQRQHALAESDSAKSALLAEQQRLLDEIKRRNVAFSRFVPSAFLQQLDRPEVADVQLGDHIERVMSVLFTDIRSFTTLSERWSPEETFAFLNAYLARAGPIIRRHNGFVDKYVGDAIMALFPDRPEDALDAAIELELEVRRFDEDRARLGDVPIAVGIGVHRGRLILGTIGEEERFETTVIADAVNLASRLEGLTKIYGASIIVSDALVSGLADKAKYCLRPLGSVELRGRSTISAFELFDGDAHTLVLHKRKTLTTFEDAVRAYNDGDYSRSRELFDTIARTDPHDRPAAFLRDRSDALSAAKPRKGYS